MQGRGFEALAVRRPYDFKHNEDPKSKIVVAAINKMRDTMTRLHRLQENFSYTRKQILAAVAQLPTLHPEWKMCKNDVKDFGSVVGQRAVNLIRHVASSWQKTTKPKWVVELLSGKPTIVDHLTKASAPGPPQV